MALLLRLFVSPRLEERARRHAREAETGHVHHSAGGQLSLRERLASSAAWSDVAHNFRGDWQMLWKEVTLGFLLAGFAGLIGDGAYERLFVASAPGPLAALENVVVGPLIAILSFVCSVGNVPLAAVLWSGGISFGGVLAFIFADLVVLPILVIYRKYYGLAFALRISALMLVTMAAAALLVDGAFDGLGLVPDLRPDRADVFGSIGLDYKLALNLVGAVVFVALFALTLRRGATDPVCGMTVDRGRALRSEYAGATYYFCSAHCRERFESDPARHVAGVEGRRRAAHAH
jgi:YHS domain-containing protein